MKLRWRFLLLFLVAAFVPFTALGIVVQRTLLQNLEADHRRQLETRVASAERKVRETLEGDRRAVEALCEHDLVVDRLLLDLATERFGPEREQALVSFLPPMMRGRRFDVLFLLDASARSRGRILGAGHYPDRVGGREPRLVDAVARSKGAPFVTEVRVWDGAAPRDARVLVSGCTVGRDGAVVAVLAGRSLDERFGSGLLGDVSPVHFALAAAGAEESTLPGLAHRQPVYTFERSGGDAALTLVAGIDDAPLRAEVEALKQRGLLIAIAALMAALLAALLLTLTLTRSFGALEEAARRVASGDLESQVIVRGRDEVSAAMSAFNEMTRELAATRRKLLRAERIAAWREVARRIAHEIKNPLQPIQMEVETLRKLHARRHPRFDEEFDGSTQVILGEVKRMNAMVTEFSRFARLPRPRPTELDLREIAEHVAGLESGTKLKLAVPDEPLRIRADRDQLTQALLNLLQNASDAAQARHGAGRGHVWLTLEATPEGACLRVEDDGPGIALDDRMRVFEPYYTTKAKGTGLGLAIVHRIVGDHGGSIDVEEGPSGGAAFVVQLPASGPPAEIAASTIGESAIPLSRPRRRE